MSDDIRYMPWHFCDKVMLFFIRKYILFPNAEVCVHTDSTVSSSTFPLFGVHGGEIWNAGVLIFVTAAGNLVAVTDSQSLPQRSNVKLLWDTEHEALEELIMQLKSEL